MNYEILDEDFIVVIFKNMSAHMKKYIKYFSLTFIFHTLQLL